MKHLKKYENIYNSFDIETIIPKNKVYDAFEKYSLSCDPKQNKNLNIVEYDNDKKVIKCSFTAYTYDGKVSKNILDILQKIMYNLNADDFTFGNYSRFGSYLVTFKYSNDTLKKVQIKNDVEKYNL